jgi:antibiotic biosynthesis monooxygenase (ABM) superfamily enzyme
MSSEPTATTALGAASLDVPLGTEFPVDSNEPLTVLAKHHVLHDKHHVFMKWTQEMNQLVHKFQGFVNFEIIRPTKDEFEHSTGVDEYIAIVRFDKYKNLNVWVKSSERHMLMERTKEYSTEQPEYSLHSLEHWFMTSDDVPKGMAAPTRWKMYVVAIMVSYSQTVWVPKVTGRIFPNARKDHLYAFQFLNVLIVVTMATFVLFPVATRALSFWLMPGVNYKAKLLQLVPCVRQKTDTKLQRQGVNP